MYESAQNSIFAVGFATTIMNRRHISLILILITAGITSIWAADDRKDPVTSAIHTPTEYADSIAILRQAPEWIRTYLSSLIRGNVDRTREKKLDISVGLSPSYTREASFGLGAMCTGLYRVNRNDTLRQPSDIFASINASLNGFYVFTLKGNNLFPDDRSRLSYKLEVYRKNLDFWGITSEATANNPKSSYERRQIDLQAEYVYRVNRNLFIGAEVRADYTDARSVSNPEYLLGEAHQYYVTGIGLSFEIDSRDNILTPTRGVHLAYKPMIFPKFMGDAPSFFNSHQFIANAYVGLWLHATLAFDLYAKINSGKTPWTMREMVASDGIRMRGYYMGSYIDNSQIASQIELRQHLWNRFGATAWIGGATVFSSLDDFKHQDIKPEWLHNWGVGLRFEFKHNVNLRIDYGFGKHTSGLVFAVGEAF